MRLLMIIDSLSSGGAERQLSYLAKGLHQRGHQVKMLSFFPEKDFFAPYVQDAGVELVWDTRGRNPWRRIGVIARHVGKERPDAVVAYLESCTMAACLSRMLKRFKLVVSERNTSQDLSGREKAKFMLYRMADCIVPNSHTQARFIEMNYPSLMRKVRTITNMLDCSPLTPLDRNQAEEVLNVVTLARITPQKNVLSYLDALALLPQSYRGKIRVRWYGACLDALYKAQVMARLTQLNLEDMVTFHDPEPDVAKLYGPAHIFCLPSIYEGFPNVLCEAMAAGLPVACSNVCDNGDIVQDGISGQLFDPHDPQEVARSLRRIIAMTPEQRKEMGAHARQRVQSLCDPEQFLDSYEQILEQL